MAAVRDPLPFPFVSPERFAQGCGDLVALVERAGRQHHWQCLDLTPDHWGVTCLRIVRLLPPASAAAAAPIHEPFDAIDESDEEELPRARHTTRSPRVEYSIVLSPIYRVPVLYFNFHDVPAASNASVEQIQDLIVPPQYHAQVKSVGVMGGISMTNHPVTDIPVFFVHPCNTAAALQETASTSKPSPLQYIVQWLGIAGACVGLHLPMDLALQADRTH